VERLQAGTSIKEGVIALNVFGIQTSGSCEGHIDRGTNAPWIDVQAERSQASEGQMKELLQDREKNKEELKALSAEIERKNLAEQRKLFPHLDEFYRNRDVPFHRRLIIGSVRFGRLESQGARLQKIEDDTTKRERLNEYQAEMSAFIAFLKDKYLREDDAAV
jgi:hypothetical protein